MVRHLLTLAMLIANAVPCALAVSFLILSLLLALNPETTPGLLDLVGGWVTLFLAYGVPLLLGLPLAFAAVRFFAARPLQMRWFHLRSAVWFLVVGIGGAASLLAFNLDQGADILGRRGRQRFAWTIALIVLAWLAATGLAAAAQWARGAAGDRRRRIAFLLLAASVPLSLPAWSFHGPRGNGGQPLTPEVGGRGGPVFLLALEGATFAEILPLVSEGRLPNFSRLLKEGAHGPLLTVHPCRFTTAWASLGTGNLPSRHGVKDRSIYRLAGMSVELRAVPSGVLFRTWLGPWALESRDVAGHDLRTRPLWSILDLLRVEAVFLGWPLADAPRPRGLEGEAGERRARASDWTRRILGGGRPGEKDEERVRQAVEADLEAIETFLRVGASARPRVLAAHLPGMGTVGVGFPGHVRPEEIEEPGTEASTDRGHVVERYYEMLDQFLGEAWASLPPEGHMLVVSAYGTEPAGGFPTIARRITGLQPRTSGHDDGPAGVFLIAGPGVAAGKGIDELHVADVLPLTLYLLGLPVGRDIDGRLPKGLFERSFLAANPITFISSYR